MGQIGKIEKIQYCPQKGKTYIQTQERSVSVEKGLEGDYHGEKGDAILTLWTLEARTILESGRLPGCRKSADESGKEGKKMSSRGVYPGRRQETLPVKNPDSLFKTFVRGYLI